MIAGTAGRGSHRTSELCRCPDFCPSVVIRTINCKSSMILKQYYLGCLAHASYLLGDEASATAIIVDPQRDIQQYLDGAEDLGLQIRHVFLSHFHADFVAGHLELRDRCGAAIHLGSRSKAEYAFHPM